MRNRSYDSAAQLLLPFSAVLNRNFLSNHWLEHRLPLEPEWEQLGDDARRTLDRLLDLWKTQKARVEHYGDEAGLEHGFIQPVLSALGWAIKYQTYVQNRRPDYALFLTEQDLDTALRVDRKEPSFWDSASVVADAKAWHVNLDKPTREASRREYPPEQLEWYLDRTRCDYGFLTNGRLWRLVPRTISRGNPRFQTYLEVDLPRLLDSLSERQGSLLGTDLEEFLRFYFFFSPHAFARPSGRTPLVERAIAGSSEYRLGVSDDLRTRVFEAMRLCIEGFLRLPQNELNPETDLDKCRENGLVFLYRLLFIMYAEDRALLPYRVNRTYTNNRSLARYRDDIARSLDRESMTSGPVYSMELTTIWDDLIDLFDLINDGRRQYEVKPFNGGLFDPDQHQFLQRAKISDWYLARVIDQLGRAPDTEHELAGLFRVDYRDLAIHHLGSIYEGLLELKPRFAAIDLWQYGSQTTNDRILVPTVQDAPHGYKPTEVGFKAGTVYLETDKGDRRSTGSYYTPEHIVEFIVEGTLSPLCKRIASSIESEIKALEVRLLDATTTDEESQEIQTEITRLMGDFDDRVLQTAILDPAMGSGHFLIRACQYLAEEIATNPYTSDEDAEQLEGDDHAITFWQRRVVESCIFGVDANSMAVELAKLALWLDCAEHGQPLNYLDHHLKVGNSLVGSEVDRLGVLPDSPPLLKHAFENAVAEKLPAVLATIAKIEATQSETIRQVKQKERDYTKGFLEATHGLRLLADAHSAYYVLPSVDRLSPADYENAVERIDELQSLADFPSLHQAVDAAKQEVGGFFHWELEFPEVFFKGDRRKDNPGFDVIVGNPPYDVISEKEIGRSVDGLKRVIASEAIYEPSRKGKNNLYKLFICRATALLKSRGRLGFIVPMPLLGDEQASRIRRRLIQQGHIETIIAFPQKDDPKRRVFRDAKLSTSVFVFERHDEASDSAHLEIRTMPDNRILEDAKSLRLKPKDIPLYDPVNSVIPSCQQDDWELVIKILASGKTVRLGEICKSFQGEVNETNEGKAGSILVEAESGPILRGANLTMYAVRSASQGETRFLDEARFFRDKPRDSKAYHSVQKRVGFQRSSPQNNYRRLVAALIPENRFCFDTISYIPHSECSALPEVVLGYLNSKVADWYFRLGSTNSKVNEYQFNNLPFPRFSEQATEQPDWVRSALSAITESKWRTAVEACRAGLNERVASAHYQEIIEALVQRISDSEQARGEVPKNKRSSLVDRSQPIQDVLDWLFARLLGLDDRDVDFVHTRLKTML